ncbi:MAG: proliferating cell nuclear antigen (pcna) [Candidatus Nanohaloarchaea archaeon]
MFKAELDDVSLIQDSMKTVSDLISEGIFQLKEDGVKLVAADPAMVALVDFQIEKEVFDSYNLEEENNVGLNLENLYSILRRANSDDTITLETRGDSKFYVTIENSSTREFSLPILNLSEDDMPSTDDLDYSVTAELETQVLESAVKDALVVGDSVAIESDSSGLYVKSEGDQSNVEFEIDRSADGVLEFSGGEARSMFSLDYLNNMIGAKKLSDTVRLSLGDDFPMRLDFEVPDEAMLSFVLAPRIEEE